MQKIKYQGGITKLLAALIGKRNKKKFATFIDSDFLELSTIVNDKTIELDIVSFSSNNDFYEQILSILSFLRYSGTPVSWTVYSDGSHTDKQIQFLKSKFQFLKFNMIDQQALVSLISNCRNELVIYKSYLKDYAHNHPLGKRLFLYLNFEIVRPTLFLDSDIVFYQQAKILKTILKEKVNGWFLPENEWGSLDSRYITTNSKEHYQVNGGFLLFNSNLTNFSDGLEFLKSLGNKYEYFTEQTIMHIILKINQFIPLDPRKFILNDSDQFDYSYLVSREKIAIRHYTGPVRHKMWQRNWKWHLSLS